MTQQNGEPRPCVKKASKAEQQEATEIINRLQESGDYKKLQEKLLMEILSKNPEWWDAMRLRTREVMQPKEGGILDITMDELTAELLPTGKSAVPEELKLQLMMLIQESLKKCASRRI